MTAYLAKPRLGNQKAPTQWPSEATATVTNEHGELEVIGKCRRQAYFRLLLDTFSFSPQYEMYRTLVEYIKSVEEDVDPYLRWIWKQGELYEEFCIQASQESGVFIATQTQVYIPKWNVSGKIDLVVINPATGKYHIIEVKSVYGYNANYVLGTPAERKRGVLGKPRDSHLMQIALYQYHYANNDDRFDCGYLVYGARDTGRYAEYEVTVEPEEDEEGNVLHYIHYKGNAPCKTSKTKTNLTIENIAEQYVYIQKCVDSGEIPERDFETSYDDDKIQKLFERGELNKKDSEQFVKRKKQLEEGKTRVVKAVEKGDWQCRFCAFRQVCYNEDNTPKNIRESI